MKTFSRIAIIAKPTGIRAELIQTVLGIVKAAGATPYLDSNAARFLGNESIGLAFEALAEVCDCAITIGGDGTMIGLARVFSLKQIPIIGINAGRLGFITDIDEADVPAVLPAMLQGHYETDERKMLEGTLLRDGQVVFHSLAVNDIGICHGRALGMVQYTLRVNDKCLTVQRADGVIVSTATGSTAYAMSAGGPIMHPSVNSILIVPIAPHTLTNRPVIVKSSSEIEIILNETRSAVATFDAQVLFDSVVGDVLKIHAHPTARFIMLHPEGFDQFELLSRKLHWRRTDNSEKNGNQG